MQISLPVMQINRSSTIASLHSELLGNAGIDVVQAAANSLRSLSAIDQEEAKLQTLKRIMGAHVAGVSDIELEKYSTELMHLIESWLDEFEMSQFGGVTLKKLMEG